MPEKRIFTVESITETSQNNKKYNFIPIVDAGRAPEGQVINMSSGGP